VRFLSAVTKDLPERLKESGIFVGLADSDPQHGTVYMPCNNAFS
jgi:hypothetical protein